MQQPKGFTLIEILVALFIFVIIVGLVSLSFRQTIINKEVLSDNIDDWILFQKGMAIIENDLKQVVIWQRGVAVDAPSSFYTRDQDWFFARMGYTNPDFTQPTSTLRKIHYQVTASGLNRIVYNATDQKQYEERILSSVTQFEWLFFDDKEGVYDIWPPTNQWRSRLPSGIQLTITHPRFGMIERIFKLPQEFRQDNVAIAQ